MASEQSSHGNDLNSGGIYACIDTLKQQTAVIYNLTEAVQQHVI
jgi:hypothetical protein